MVGAAAAERKIRPPSLVATTQGRVEKGKPRIRIIHIYAPQIIQTDVANFRELVQRLTGMPTTTTPLNKKKKKGRRGRRRSGGMEMGLKWGEQKNNGVNPHLFSMNSVGFQEVEEDEELLLRHLHSLIPLSSTSTFGFFSD